MLEIERLKVAIQSVEVLRGISLTVKPGEMVGLVGRNGAGKTTSLRAVMGLVAPTAGNIRFAETPLTDYPTHERARFGIGYMPEDRRLVPEFTVEENIRLPTWATKMSGVDERLDWIFSIMPEIASFRARRALELSGGQQKMVALARALMAGRRMLLLDEPFEGLAPALARRLGEVLANLKAQSVSVLLSESNEIHVADLLVRTYRIERGSVTRA